MSIIYPIQAVSGLPSVGTSGSVITSNGSSWVSASPQSAFIAVDYNLIGDGDVNLMIYNTLADSGSLSLTLLTATDGTGVVPAVTTNPDISGLNNFNATSISASGNSTDGGYLYIASPNAGLEIGTADFSWEAFCYFNNQSAQFIFDTRETVGGSPGFYVGYSTNIPGKIEFGTNGSWITSTTNTSTGSWHHIVIDRRSGQARIKVDGVLQYGPVSFTSNITQNNLTIFGPIERDSAFANMYMNDMRFVIGGVVYGDNYVIPTASLTASALPTPAAPGQQIMSQAYVYSCLSGGLTPIWNKSYVS